MQPDVAIATVRTMLIDTHAHLDEDAFSGDLERVLEHARAAGFPDEAVSQLGLVVSEACVGEAPECGGDLLSHQSTPSVASLPVAAGCVHECGSEGPADGDEVTLHHRVPPAELQDVLVRSDRNKILRRVLTPQRPMQIDNLPAVLGICSRIPLRSRNE